MFEAWQIGYDATTEESHRYTLKVLSRRRNPDRTRTSDTTAVRFSGYPRYA